MTKAPHHLKIFKFAFIVSTLDLTVHHKIDKVAFRIISDSRSTALRSPRTCCTQIFTAVRIQIDFFTPCAPSLSLWVQKVFVSWILPSVSLTSFAIFRLASKYKIDVDQKDNISLRTMGFCHSPSSTIHVKLRCTPCLLLSAYQSFIS